ncbi:MAG: HAD family hydrolase [Bacteroidetes Order II. Incertae sedis bacterium]|nr:HAD family hydrolase [Bacteroidetes Order II. bacterium]
MPLPIQVIAFDADDTLWVNEPHYQHVEQQFCGLLEDFLPRHTVSQELFRTEMDNLSLYGYGAKAFMLSMIETAIRITEGRVGAYSIQRIIDLGREMLHEPIELLPDVQTVLEALQVQFRLVVATKGDLLDQERKLEKSGLASYFHHIEIMSDKKERDYRKLLHHLEVPPEAFLMIGNSLRSDVLPALNLGGWGFHVPYHTTWEHEKIDVKIENERFRTLETLKDILPILL